MGFPSPLLRAIDVQVQDYRQLLVWQKAMSLTAMIYSTSRRFPKAERFGLTQQLRRAANSIGANIAEGTGRNSPADFTRFLRYAVGSANEVEHHLLLAHRLRYVDDSSYSALSTQITDIRKMLSGLISSVQSTPSGNG